jgi:hypothetical protein
MAAQAVFGGQPRAERGTPEIKKAVGCIVQCWAAKSAVRALGHGPHSAQRGCEQAFGPNSVMNSKVYEFLFYYFRSKL